MANGHSIKNYSALDIEKYQKGMLSSAEMHAMEKAALEDPFLADAMEGYKEAGTSLQADLEDLKNRLAQRTAEKTNVIPFSGGGTTSFSWMRAAVMAGVMTGAGLLAYFFLFNTKDKEIAQFKKSPESVTVLTDSGKSIAQVPVTAKDSQASALTKTDFPDTKKQDKTAGFNDVKNAKQKEETGNTPSGELQSEELVIVNDKTKDLPKKASREADKLVKQQYPATTEKADHDLAKKAAGGNGYTTAVPVATEQTRNKTIDPARKMDETNFFKSNIFRGRVTDGLNYGVPFAKVTNTEDNVGTYTDARGFFNLTYPDTVLNVQVRSIGYENNTIQLKNSLPNNQIILQNDSRSLNALVLNNQRPNASRRADNNNVKLEEPVPADGWENYDTYLTNNLVVPEEYRNKPTATSSTAVELSFEVDAKGEPVNIRVEKSLCEKCDKEAIRLIKEGPKWKRNVRNGRTTVTIPFNQLF